MTKHQNPLQGLARALLVLACMTLPPIGMAQILVPGTTPGKFDVGSAGAASYSIPIQLPPGAGSVEPRLALEYSSQAGNGWVGLGWNVQGLSAISRCPATMATDGVRGSVKLDSNDRFCLDGQRLVLVAGSYGGNASEYKTEVDSFSRILAYGTAGNGPAYFKVQTKAGLTMYFGNTADSRIEPQGKTTPRLWALNRVEDTRGNYFNVTYAEDSATGSFHVSRLDYTGNTAGGQVPAYSVEFLTESRPDIDTHYFLGSISRTTQRLKQVRVSGPQGTIRQYAAIYDPDSTKASRLTKVQECRNDTECLPPVVFTYTPDSATTFSLHATQPGWGPGTSITNAHVYPIFTGDWNGDGRMDWGRVQSGSVSFFVANGGSFTEIAAIQGWGTSAGFSDGNTFPVLTGDWNGDGKTDWARVQTLGITFFISTGSGFVQWAHVSGWGTNAGFTNGNVYPIVTGDWNGDGRTDWARVQSNFVSFFVSTDTGFAHLYDHAGWGVNGGFTDSNAYPIVTGDWNGDGKTDWARVHSAGIRFFVSTGSAFTSMTDVAGWGTGNGFTDANTYPILTGDWNGDGLTDWARVQHSAVSFFLSTGSGFTQLPSYPGFSPSQGFNDAGVHPIFTGDWDADGKTDWARVQHGGITFFRSNGSTFEQALFFPGWGPADGFSDGSAYPLIQGDWNGDGKTDWARVQSASVSFFAGPGARSGLLASVAGQQSITLQYAPATGNVYVKDSGADAAVWPQVDVQAPIFMVSEVKTANGVGGTTTVRYTYGGLKAEPSTGRGAIGLRWMSARATDTGVETYSQFRQDFPYVGMVSKTETRLAGAGQPALLKRTTHTYGSTGNPPGNVYFVYASGSLEESWDLGGVPLPSVTTEYQYAGTAPFYGDPSLVRVTTSDGASRTTTNEYWPADTAGNHWILGRLKKATVTSAKP